jgi:uncharacterized membrane protein YozB (DUF420 family)
MTRVDFAIERLPAVNATLNALATLLLACGWVLIKRRRERAHKWTMLAAFGVSCAFLACYLFYHYSLKARYNVAGVPFSGPANLRPIYLTMLASHVLLAAVVPFLAIATIYLGLRDRRAAHRRLARWTFPIWLYVSVTGVLIYFVLYHVYPAPPGKAIMQPAAEAAQQVGAGAIGLTALLAEG